MHNQAVIDETETCSGMASLLLNESDGDLKMPLKKYLNDTLLDFSLESLKIVDDYLSKVRKSVKDLSEEEYIPIITRCGSYCGEVVRRNSKHKFIWTNFDSASKIAPAILSFGKSLYTHFLLFREDNQGCSFPMAKVQKFLEAGEQDSLYGFALVVGEFKKT